MQIINHTVCYTATEIRSRYNGTRATFEKCDQLEKSGYVFIPGNNPGLGKTLRWADHAPIRVAQTNSRWGGYSEQTLWAVRPLN